MTTLEDYLKDQHAKDYKGTDDDMAKDFDFWLAGLDGGDIMGFAEELIATKNQQIEKLMKSLDEAIDTLKKIGDMAI